LGTFRISPQRKRGSKQKLYSHQSITYFIAIPQQEQPIPITHLLPGDTSAAQNTQRFGRNTGSWRSKQARFKAAPSEGVHSTSTLTSLSSPAHIPFRNSRCRPPYRCTHLRRRCRAISYLTRILELSRKKSQTFLSATGRLFPAPNRFHLVANT